MNLRMRWLGVFSGLALIIAGAALGQVMYEYGGATHGSSSGQVSASMAQPITVLLDGAPQRYPVPPYMAKASVMVPMRGIFESLGAKVAWDRRARMVTATREGTEIRLRVGDPGAVVNGKRVALQAPAQMTQNTVFVPLRFVSEALGAGVEWHAAERMVMIQRRMPEGPGPAGAAREAAPEAAMPRPAATMVHVMLKEYTITAMPAKVKAGAIEFHVMNQGTMPHALAIDGMTEKTRTLSAGESATLTVTLKPGAYTLYCPVGRHRGAGMEARFTVE